MLNQMPMLDERKAMGRLIGRSVVRWRSACDESELPCFTNEFVGIESDLHPIVQHGEQGSDGKGSNENGDETKLQD